MPSLAPQGTTIANLRRAIGYTQVELALRVGVSERTVRNAERGASIKRDFLKFIANGLGVSVAEVMAPSAAENIPLPWQRNAERLLEAVRRLIVENNSSALVSLAARDLVIRRDGAIPDLAVDCHLPGEFYGVSGLVRLVAKGRQIWQECGDVDYYVESPTGGGNVVVLRCGHEVPLRCGAYGWARSVAVCEFAQERLVRVDEFLGLGSGPPETGLLARYSKAAAGRTGGALGR